MRRWKVAAAVMAAGLLMAACGGSTTTKAGGQNKTLEFGAVLSLTGVGGVYGVPQRQGIELAVDTINRDGGVAGAKLHFDVQDDGSDKAQAAQVTQRMIQEGRVLALIGPTLSNSAVAAHPIADSAKTPMLAVSNTGFKIVGDCDYPCTYIFRDSLGEADAIPANIRTYADKAHPKTAALLYPNDDKFSVDGAQVVKDNVAASGIKLVETVEFTKAEADLSPYVTRVVNAKPDVIFITSLGNIPPKIMGEARRQGFTGQFLGGNGFNTAAVSKAAGDAGKGAQSASAWYIGNDVATNADFVKAYRQKYNADPDQFAAQAYTGVLILADSVKRANLSFSDLAGDRTKLRTAMEKTSIDSPLGPFRFTAKHDVRQTIWIIAMDGAGGFTLTSSIKPQ